MAGETDFKYCHTETLPFENYDVTQNTYLCKKKKKRKANMIEKLSNDSKTVFCLVSLGKHHNDSIYFT